jgi:hypothetical protein
VVAESDGGGGGFGPGWSFCQDIIWIFHHRHLIVLLYNNLSNNCLGGDKTDSMLN